MKPGMFHVSVSIEGSQQKIWDVLTDVANWTTWNTTVTRVDGKIQPGAKLLIYAKISPNRPFPVKVGELIAPQRMLWIGGMPLGLFTGRRTFTLTPESGGLVRFEMTEKFTGLLAPLIKKVIPDLQPAFDEFAACLKNTIESRA